MSWKEQAKALPIGQSRKIVCCSSDKSTYISQDNYGLRKGPCLRCGHKEFIKHGPRSAAEILAARRAQSAVESLEEIPARCVPLYSPDVPSEAILWTLAGGLTPERATDFYGMKYDPLTRRVCLPIVGGFLARAVFNDKPKYVKAGASKTEMYKLVDNQDKAIVVVEDILSAIAVHRAGFNSIAVLGTSITTKIAQELGSFPVVVSWTDADKAGDAAWVKLRRKLALYPVNLKRVRTDKDPKELNRSEIAAKLGEVL